VTAKPDTAGTEGVKPEVGKTAGGKTVKKTGKGDKPKAKAARSKGKAAKPKDDASAESAERSQTRPATNANGVTQTAALTPGTDPDDILSGLIR
jgi:hypothetical protein